MRDGSRPPGRGKLYRLRRMHHQETNPSLNTILLSSDDRVTSTDRSAIAKDAPRRSKVRRSRVASSANSTSSCCSSTDVIEPSQISGIPKLVKTVKFKTVLDFFHIANLRNASSDEAMFSRILYSYSADYSPRQRCWRPVLPHPVPASRKAPFSVSQKLSQAAAARYRRPFRLRFSRPTLYANFGRVPN